MEPYIRHIRINKVRHLHDIDIPVQDTTKPVEGSPVHVMLAGRNGAGKTSVLNAIRISLERQAYSPFDTEADAEQLISTWEACDEDTRLATQEQVDKCRARLDAMDREVSFRFDSPGNTFSQIRENQVLLAYYAPNRQPNFDQPKVPAVQKVGPTSSVSETRSKIFLHFLLNLKVQRSLARDEGDTDLARRIDDWFRAFVDMLGVVYGDAELRLDFDAKSYRFSIISQGKESPMDHLPDGYAALLDIIADLILKMQTQDSLISAFEMPGIVLIDEVETHLHLELQKRVMPILTRFFPKIQFIVTTHSPFVVSSIPNAVAVDLETGECMDDLDEYPYSSLAEGFFGVSQQSSYIQRRFERLKELAAATDKSATDEAEIRELLQDFEQSSKLLNPGLRAAVERLKFKYNL